ncbi:MAG: hypothetical protein V3T58_04360 [Candidatus Hydrothermarchaeales archaeon]
MNEYVAATIVIAATIGVGFFLLVNFGIAEVAYFGLGVIAVSILGSVLYTWWKTTSDKTIEKLKVETLSKIRMEFNKTQDLVTQSSNLIDIKDIQRELDAIRSSLIKLRLFDENFERVTRGVYKSTLTFIEQQTRKTEQKLLSLETLTAGSYKPELNEHIRNLGSKLQELEGAGYSIGQGVKDFDAVANYYAKSLEELVEKDRRADEVFTSLLTSCVEEVTTIASTAKKYGDTNQAEEDITKAMKRMDDLDACVSLFITARNKLKDIMASSFAKQHTRLLSSVEKHLEFLGGEATKYSFPIRELKDRISSLNDPGRMDELQELDAQFKNKLAATLAELNHELSDMEAEITPHEPGKDFWDRDDGIGELVDKVDPSQELDAFSKDSLKALKRVTVQYRKDVMFMKVLENFKKLEPIITQRLKENGKLAGPDLKVKYADKFMHFYSSKHSDVEFKENPPVLTLKSIITTELREKLRRRK